MKLQPTILRTRFGMWSAGILLLLVTTFGVAQQQGEPDFNPAHIIRTYSVHHSTPLAAVFLQVQQSFLYPISYEEVAYESPAELLTRDMTAPDGRHLHFQYIPETDFSVALTAQDATPEIAVQTILAEHKNSGLPGAGRYKMIQRANRIDVVPYQVLGANGEAHAVTPVTSYLVSFPTARRYITATLALLAAQISQASGKNVVIANQPYEARDHMIEVGASAQLPGDVVEAIATQLDTTLSYQLIYENRTATYYMSIYIVRNTKMYGNLYNNRAPGTAKPPAESPFFKKDH